MAAALLQFEPARRRRNDGRRGTDTGRVREESGKILFFTGVRIERAEARRIQEDGKTADS